MKRLYLAALGVGIGIVAVTGAGFETAASSATRQPTEGSAERSGAAEEETIRLGESIARLPVLDSFGRSELPLKRGQWSKTRWTDEVGSSWRGKWHGFGATLANNAGAFWRRARFSGAYGSVAVAATLGTGPIYERWPSEYLSLWLNMPRPGKVRSGYEVRFRGAKRSSSDYTVELSKWTSGHRTVLAKRHGISLPVDSTFALSDTLGLLEVWTGTTKLTPILSGIDLTFRGGYAGIEANRGEGTAYNFRAGNVTGEISR